MRFLTTVMLIFFAGGSVAESEVSELEEDHASD